MVGIESSVQLNTYENEALALLAISEFKGVGFETVKSIAKDKIPFSSFFLKDCPQEHINKIALNPSYQRVREHISFSDAEKYLDVGRYKRDFLRSRGISLVFPSDTSFPNQLKDLRDTPQWIFVEGDIEVLTKPSITAVGSRKASDHGRWLAQYLGYCLNDLKVPTVSGLAEGIDQIIHEASIAADVPTVAILGTGILSDYPRGSHELRKRIVDQGGAIVTEYLPKDTFSAKNFVRRNRIQAALGKCLVPLEWSTKSGTAHTVRFAFELGRSLLFVRTPHQPTFDWLPPEYRKVSANFTLPTQHTKFASALHSILEAGPHQMRLF